MSDPVWTPAKIGRVWGDCPARHRISPDHVGPMLHVEDRNTHPGVCSWCGSPVDE